MDKFIVLLEWEPSFNKMSDNQKGILFQAFFDYHNGKEQDFKGDAWVESIWLNIQPNIERMNKNYKSSVENGKKGGRPRKTQSKPNNNPIKPNNNLNKPDNNQPLTFKEKEKEKEKEEVKEKVKEEVKENANAKIEISNFDFGKLTHKQKYEYFGMIRSGIPFFVEGEIISLKDFCLIQQIPFDEEENEMDRVITSVFN